MKVLAFMVYAIEIAVILGFPYCCFKYKKEIKELIGYCIGKEKK